MAYKAEIKDILLEEANKSFPPLVAHVKNYPELNQQDVTDTITRLIRDHTVTATFHFHYRDLCTIVFKSPLD